MATYLVSQLMPLSINFGPSTEVEEVLQNVLTIMSTPQYSVPLFREFAASATYLDQPMPVAMAQLAAEITQNIPKYEPRAQVNRVTFQGNGPTGRLYPVAEVSVNVSS
jgi:phage baseplate assembly protein W